MLFIKEYYSKKIEDKLLLENFDNKHFNDISVINWSVQDKTR